eukprot:996186-Amphidinium_carterae.2
MTSGLVLRLWRYKHNHLRGMLTSTTVREPSCVQKVSTRSGCLTLDYGGFVNLGASPCGHLMWHHQAQLNHPRPRCVDPPQDRINNRQRDKQGKCRKSSTPLSSSSLQMSACPFRAAQCNEVSCELSYMKPGIPNPRAKMLVSLLVCQSPHCLSDLQPVSAS